MIVLINKSFRFIRRILGYQKAKNTYVIKFLKDNKILVRTMNPPIAHTFRMSLRMMPEMQHFMEVYSRYLNN